MPDLILLLLIVLVIASVAGGAFVTPWLWAIILIVVLVAIWDRRRV